MVAHKKKAKIIKIKCWGGLDIFRNIQDKSVLWIHAKINYVRIMTARVHINTVN